MVKRRRQSVDPLASQPRSPARRPGDFNEQADTVPDPNVEFMPTHSLGSVGDPTWVLRFARWVLRRKDR
jgi:hypothetical protein